MKVCARCGSGSPDSRQICPCGGELVSTARSHKDFPSRNNDRSSGIERKKILSRNGSSITLSQKEEIKITRKTISFGPTVYQFHNVVGFSDGEISLENIIPISVILIGLLVGFMVANFLPYNFLPYSREYGILILALSLFALMVNIYQEKKYGLLLTLTSGDKHLFITSDSKGLAQVVDQIRSFMESDDNSSYTVAVNNNSINCAWEFHGGSSFREPCKYNIEQRVIFIYQRKSHVK